MGKKKETKKKKKQLSKPVYLGLSESENNILSRTSPTAQAFSQKVSGKVFSKWAHFVIWSFIITIMLFEGVSYLTSDRKVQEAVNLIH